MAKKPLRSIAAPKDTKFDLKGVKKSSIEAGSTGEDPGVDYMPKDEMGQKFVAAHKTEKHADRVGNTDEPYTGNPEHYTLNSKKEKRHGNMQGAAQKVYEEVEELDEIGDTAKGRDFLRRKYLPGAEASRNKILKDVLPTGVSMSVDELRKKSKEINRKAGNRMTGMQRATEILGDPIYKNGRRVYEAKGMKCETCSKEECECGAQKKLLLGGKKGLAEIIAVKEGAKVDRMVGYITANEKKAGHSSKEAENIAWATVNKRGMLDNKNKKMHEDFDPNSPLARGQADEHYGRPVNPHKLVPDANGNLRTVKLTNPEEIAQYMTGRENNLAGKKVYEEKSYNDTEEEVSMVTTELKAMIADASELLKKMPKNMHIEPWVQAKVATAKASICSIHDYIIYGNVKEDLAMPMLEGGKKKKKNTNKLEKESSPSDVPMSFSSGNVGDGVAQGRV